MKKLVSACLSTLAHRKLKKFKPVIVAVTGSVGKTSTRNAIAIALAAKYRVRSPHKNYNNEIGLPLAILGETSPGKDAWAWGKLFMRQLNRQDMPEYLVLEYGADKPGDIAALVKIAAPQIAVITALSPVHAANYPSLEALAKEKGTLGEAVLPDGLVVLNGDDSGVLAMRSRFIAPVKTYSLTNGDAYATDIRFEFPTEESFDIGEAFIRVRAMVHVGNQAAELVLTNCCSTSLISASLAALTVAVQLGVPFQAAAQALGRQLRPLPGRLYPLAGIKGSLILDDSYNAAPASMLAGLEALAAFTPGEEYDRRIAVLGDMAELGDVAPHEHDAVGRRVAQVADVFIGVGMHMQIAIEAAIAAGLPREQTHWFKDALEAGRYLDGMLQQGDVVLVKGSQSQRMEKVVKDVMAEPLRAAELLVRQEDKWLKE